MNSPFPLILLVLSLISGSPIPAAPAPPDVRQAFDFYGPQILSAAVALVERRVQGILLGLSVLAASEEAKSGEWGKMEGLFRALGAGGEPLIAWFVLPDGSYWTGDKGKVDANLSDREYFPKLMAGETVVGSLVTSKATGLKSLIIAVPVKKGEKVVGGAGASVFLDKLGGEVKEALRLPETMVFYALASDGTTALHSDPRFTFDDPRRQGSPSLNAAIDRMLQRNSGEETYSFQGAVKRVIFRTSALLGWRFAVGITIGSEAARKLEIPAAGEQ